MSANLVAPDTDVPISVGYARWAARLFSDVLHIAGSTRVGVALLTILGAACLGGMLVMQQNVNGFANYFASLTPAQKHLYATLGLFDVYHSWWFNSLLAALSFNIVLATIDRVPKVWRYVSKPTLTVPLRWMRDQPHSGSISVTGDTATIVERIVETIRSEGYRSSKVLEKNGLTYVFAESGVWNRLMFVAVHVGLLTIFAGGFMTARFGSTGNLPLAPGQSSDLIYDTAFRLDQVQRVTKQLPFEVTVTDIQQKLIREDGSLSPANTIDWLTWFTIKDETGEHAAFVQMNRPFDYRGYRFFQSSFTPVGRARKIVIVATPANGGEPHSLTIERNGGAILPEGSTVVFKEFRANYSVGLNDPEDDMSTYENPAAILEVFPRNGVVQQAVAFGPQVGDIPITKKAVNGYTFKMASFEKVGDSHILSVQHDPGAGVVYAGFALLSLTLFGTFAFSHRRVWAAVESGPDGNHVILLAGSTNRSQNGFNERFERLEKAVAESLKKIS